MGGKLFVTVASVALVLQIFRCPAADVVPLPSPQSAPVSAVDDVSNVLPKTDGVPHIRELHHVPDEQRLGDESETNEPIPRIRPRFPVIEAPSSEGDSEPPDVEWANLKLDHPNPPEHDSPQFEHELKKLTRRLEEHRLGDRVKLTYRIIEKWGEVSSSPLGLLWGDRYFSHIWDPTYFGKILCFGVTEQLFEDYSEEQTVPVWNVPTITLSSGGQSRVTSGSEIVVTETGLDGSTSLSRGTFGKSLVATATILDLNRIRLSTTLECNDSGSANERTGVSAILNRRRMEATIDVCHGQTTYFAEVVRPNSRTSVLTLVAVTAELLPAMKKPKPRSGYQVPIFMSTIPASR